MKWFAVKYVYQIVSGEGSHAPQIDEQIRLLISQNISDAWSKAQALAKKFHQSFKNIKGEEVRWDFLCISDVKEIDLLEDGCEVNSVIHEPADYKAFMDDVNRHKTFLADVVENVPIH
ncbi:DUF4288 domain-containing protein [Pedobacter nutrimenti]|jgi:hypothetical protein|uniref:Uncharacterized protein DUF4288 n=1 Tax=Pedobacter nutrimenti TaxID=1241337 RepID=A0A318UJP9_9SPHI|nr:DUF4288 domain-containing protein [Pedobacter nutrimenti]PYF76582.1 uncharacterized protein DUF4288 [Pedobacter nutrimenti]